MDQPNSNRKSCSSDPTRLSQSLKKFNVSFSKMFYDFVYFFLFFFLLTHDCVDGVLFYFVIQIKTV